ncbi:MAG: hypothetical protein MjAS7_1862 [Metallosphaera javensis (ex Sakai et al. 2022)]|nr:MAG: hypothetical protein MjAS7_1862 [Metallosphaera javensis (ex Sakai et al. 2022)]
MISPRPLSDKEIKLRKGILLNPVDRLLSPQFPSRITRG